MSATCILFVSAAALMHAGWNLVSKARKPSGAFFLLATSASLAMLIPTFLWTSDIFHLIPAKLWWMLLGSGLAETIYYISLANAYRSGEISVAYPAARALPALMIPMITSLLGIGGHVAALSLAGMSLVLCGCALLPLASFRSFRDLACGRRTLACMLLAAVSIAAYSIIDSEALKLIRAAMPDRADAKVSIFYVSCLNAFIFPLMAIYVLGRRGERQALRGLLRDRGAIFPFMCGIVCTVGYTFTLAAMIFATHVSYVIALKQMSIPVGVALGLILLKERVSMPKIIGVGVITVGLVLVTV